MIDQILLLVELFTPCDLIQSYNSRDQDEDQTHCTSEVIFKINLLSITLWLPPCSIQMAKYLEMLVLQYINHWYFLQPADK